MPHGTATLLLRYGAFTLLTDPNFLHRGQRAYLGYGLTSRRRTEPALSIEQLPALDAVVLSHLHGDHWDRVTRHGLDRGIPIITIPHAARRLQGWHGFRRAVGLRSWEQYPLVKGGMMLRVTAMPGRHAPGVARFLLPPVMGSLLELGTPGGEVHHRIYLTGDTLMHEAIHQIARRYPDTDLAVLHLGGTRLPGGLMVTTDARQGAELLAAIAPRRAVPVHYDDYSLFTSPLADFRAEVEGAASPNASPTSNAGTRCRSDSLTAGMVTVMPERPLVIAFDVMETLFPLDPLGERLQAAGQPPELLPLWFTRLLRDAFALTASGGYQPFAELALGALRAVADLLEETAQEVVSGFTTLAPHPKAAEAMRLAREGDIRVITLSNGSAQSTATLLERSGLDRHVEQVVSVEAMRRWKPAPEPYLHAATVCGVPPDRMALVAAHAWDTHGAHRAGLQTGWISRFESRWSEAFDPPDVTGPDLVAVVRALLALGERPGTR